MESIRSATENKFEFKTDAESLDLLVSEFPPELQDRLWDEVAELDDYSARDYLTAKLIDRKIALLPPEYQEVPKYMEVVNENPEAIQESLEQAHTDRSEYLLGKGMNGEVIASTRQDDICYKTLFLERAITLGASVAREALMQHNARVVLAQTSHEILIPEVEGFVKTSDVHAIKMKKIDGCSLKQIIEQPAQYELPQNFDLEYFFETLEAGVQVLNDAGYFHRDLHGNAGNVMVTQNGEPRLVDFGSAVKAVGYDPEETTYAIVPNGQRYRKQDIDGVRALKRRTLEFINAET